MSIVADNNTDFFSENELDDYISYIEYTCPKCDGINKHEFFANSIVIQKGCNVELQCEHCCKIILQLSFK